ncbi:hypothetical protein N7532_000463 [Penicillium argentinense]|uniref:Uncharacterized protein n=1 Tax=Penicillium argentinense TaxID=1131581 RepID=A0A9W9G5E7_9EURO|nr:uncharacterized protein N7532_000463 [Penicillium argentinense]KAJ5112418.1 hypothetical protein N7532_000463 [Penicillium argentinense]
MVSGGVADTCEDDTDEDDTGDDDTRENDTREEDTREEDAILRRIARAQPHSGDDEDLLEMVQAMAVMPGHLLPAPANQLSRLRNTLSPLIRQISELQRDPERNWTDEFLIYVTAQSFPTQPPRSTVEALSNLPMNNHVSDDSRLLPLNIRVFFYVLPNLYLPGTSPPHHVRRGPRLGICLVGWLRAFTDIFMDILWWVWSWRRW